MSVGQLIYSTHVALAHEMEANLPPGVSLLPIRRFKDSRGVLVPIDLSEAFPFIPVRCFFVAEVPSGEVRGRHAHRSCHQVLTMLSGSLDVVVDSGRVRSVVTLSTSSGGLHIPPMVWGEQLGHSCDAVLGVFCSLPYDLGDYISDYDEFMVAAEAALTRG